MFIEVRELPDTIQSALRSCGYAKKDVQVLIKEKESVHFSGGDGYRGFACIVNISTGAREIIQGSWGGSNMFNQTNHVDLNDNQHTIPQNGCVIRGFTGGTSGATHCTVTLSPKNVMPCLTAKPDLSEDELYVLGVVRSYKSSYRKPLLESKQALVDCLVTQGYLVRNKAGAISLSTKGKNAAEGVRV